MTQVHAITPDLVTAYWFCKRKAFSLLRGDTSDPHEYVRVIEAHAANTLYAYLSSLKVGDVHVHQGHDEAMATDAHVLANVTLRSGYIEATADALMRISSGPSRKRSHYEPHLALGTYAITKEHKIRLAFVGYVLAKVHHYLPTNGTIVNVAGTVVRIQLPRLIADLVPIVDALNAWKTNLPSDPPPIILNDHCLLCPFRIACLAQAEKEDNLSLLDRMTPKLMQKYHKKGIFTINQLSFLFRPRRQRRKGRQISPGFNVELQALALRTKKIYVHQPPSIPEHPTELFLDMEGVPDHAIHYLIGLIVYTQGRVERHSLWADSPAEEQSIFTSLLRVAEQYPDAPIYHYGSHEPKALERIARKYGLCCEAVTKRLVNVNQFVFGKVYFPARSNTLKDLGALVGATWSASDASGLQSMVWRFQWETSKNDALKNQIIVYNLEDCEALRLLVVELRNIGQAAATRSDVDFADTPKQNTTCSGQLIHDSLDGILRSAHAEYRRNHVSIGRGSDETGRKLRGSQKGHPAFRRIVPARVGKVIRVRRRSKCPRHKNLALEPTGKVAGHTVIDLIFTKKGCRKTVTKYVGIIGHCRWCSRDYVPAAIRRFRSRVFGHRFRAWVVYQRVALRLPYDAILQVTEDLFREQISEATLVSFVVDLAEYYAFTEKMLMKGMLSGPFIHVDETRISIQGTDHYVWVLTDGVHVVFRLTETREATLVRKILDGYSGVLISDFYGGYDACKCRQQKCLSHLIRDLNDALWKNPYNSELEGFVGAFKNALVPIMADVEKYGLKRWHLIKHGRAINRFYKKVIDGVSYKDEVTRTYQKRFVRYKESLFRFLEEDGIPWNNNMAERAIRHLAIQRKISGSFFKRVAVQYLRLLGIAQTCRFQRKSFLAFLLSGERDIDRFRERRLPKATRLVGSAKYDGEFAPSVYSWGQTSNWP